MVGGDSLVGSGLLRALRKRGHKVYATTRRKGSVNEERIFLDFESDEQFLAPPDVDYAFIVGAATNYDRCENDPLAYKINVELIPKLIGSLLEKGLFVSFISTNSVFGGQQPWPNEDTPHAPGIAYAVQKHKAENAVQDAARRFNAELRSNIVRLTKILDRNTSPLPNWFDSFNRGEILQPFSDLIFAPMSVRFVGDALATLGEMRIYGNLHLSGAENVSYVDFALALANKIHFNPCLIVPTTATAKGVHIGFKPTYSGLGMARTTELSGIRPQKMESVLDDLLSET